MSKIHFHNQISPYHVAIGICLLLVIFAFSVVVRTFLVFTRSSSSPSQNGPTPQEQTLSKALDLLSTLDTSSSTNNQN